MTIIQAVILGTIQGLTEFLPVSSSGHLIFIPKIFGWGDQGLPFDVVAHLGTLLAVVVYFRKKLWVILASFFVKKGEEYRIENIESGIKNMKDRNPDSRFHILNSRRMGWMILVSVIPAGVVGLLFGDWLETNLRAAWIVGVGMIFWGVVLGVADYASRKHLSTKALQHAKWRDALFIGCAQAVALIPGTSRSGITMTAGLFSKLDKKSVAEFSFLMSVPIIALAGAAEFFKLIKEGVGDLSILVLGIGFIASAVSGFIAIWGLMKIIQRWSFMPFVVYRIVIGVAILIWLV